MPFTWFQAKTLHTSITDTPFFFFFFFPNFPPNNSNLGTIFFLKKKKKSLLHFNEFVFPSHENTGKFILELLTGLRSGELLHRMNTMTTREKLVAAVLQGSRVGMWVPSRWERVLSLPGPCYCHSRNLSSHGGAQVRKPLSPKHHSHHLWAHWSSRGSKLGRKGCVGDHTQAHIVFLEV